MMEPAQFDELLARYLNGELTDAERNALADILRTHPAAQAAFDQALYDEALLQAAHHPKSDARALAQVLAERTRPAPRRLRMVFMAGGLAAMLALVAAWAFGFGGTAAPARDVAVAGTDAQERPENPLAAQASHGPLRCVVFGMVEDGYDGARFRFRSSLVFRRLAGEAPLSGLEGKTFDVQVPGDLSTHAAEVDPGHEDGIRKLKRGLYVTLLLEVDAHGSIKLLKVPEGMGPHYPGQCACKQGIDLPPAQPQAGKTQG